MNVFKILHCEPGWCVYDQDNQVDVRSIAAWAITDRDGESFEPMFASEGRLRLASSVFSRVIIAKPGCGNVEAPKNLSLEDGLARGNALIAMLNGLEQNP